MGSPLKRMMKVVHRRTEPEQQRGSLAYRRNKEAIWAGEVPEKYTRIAAHVPGNRVLEFGAAEGVLALLIAQDKQQVFALEKRQERHGEALALQAAWQSMGYDVSRCEMVLGTLDDHPHLLEEVDTFVAVRSIYYLRDRIEPTFDLIGRHVEHVLLCGNRHRAKKYRQGRRGIELGEYNYYATAEGMAELLRGAGYRIVRTVDDGDPIVVGRREDGEADGEPGAR